MHNAWILPVLVLDLFFNTVEPSSHWVVTQEGKIQVQPQSMFEMKRPYDLMAFLEQEKRVELLESLRKELKWQNSLDMGQEDASFEARFYQEDRDCVMAGKPLTEFDLHAETVMIPTQEYETLKQLYSNDNLLEPRCSQFGKSFTIRVLDKLSSMTRREELKFQALSSDVHVGELQPNSFRLRQFGNAVVQKLEDDPTSWSHFLLAVNYWRVNGNILEEIECLRCAIHFAPDSRKHFGQTMLANIFHRSHRVDDAIAVLEEAREVNPANDLVHFNLANVYASILDFDKAEEYYSNALFLNPNGREVYEPVLHAVRCHKKLEMALESEHKHLLKVVEDLREYKKQHETLSSLIAKLVAEQATPDARLNARMSYEQLKIMSSKDGKGQYCSQIENMGMTLISCNLQDGQGSPHQQLIDDESEELKQRQLADMLKSFEGRVDSIGILSKSGDDIETSNDTDHEDPYLPSMPPKYAAWPEPVQNPDWPLAEDCSLESKVTLPDLKDFPTVFLSPENKGFNVRRMMSEDVEFPIDSPAPLPWMPPVCKRYEGTIAKYDKLKTLRQWTYISSKKREQDIEPAYDLHSPERNFHEWGARVTAAMKINLAPKWIVFLLAGTYWRIWGHPQNGLHCYRHALARVPEQYKDVVLTNLAGLVYTAGSLDDALVLAVDSHHIDDKDPETNFLLGNLYLAKGNYSGAWNHYKQTIRMNSTYLQRYPFMTVPGCHLKFEEKKEVEQEEPQEVGPSQAASEEVLYIPHEDAFIMCKAGSCKIISKEELENEATESSTNQSGSGKKGKKKKKKKSGKKNKSTEDDVIASKAAGKSNQPGVEIGTIAETSAEEEDQFSKPEATDADFIGPVQVKDSALPDVMIRVREKISTPLPSSAECSNIKQINWDTFTSTWLSVTAKGINIRDHVVYPSVSDPIENKEPHCPSVPVSLLTLDHLEGVKMRQFLQFASEIGLTDAFQGLTSEDGVSLADMANRVSLSLELYPDSWVLSTSAALYWRVVGNAEEAINCLRHALHFVPSDMRDVPLISLANILHRAGLYNDALIVTNMALENSPKFVVVHFTMANIYMSKGDLDMAEAFYLSSLALHSTFEPARDRLLTLQCDRVATLAKSLP